MRFEADGSGWVYEDTWNGHAVSARISRLKEIAGRVGAEVAIMVDDQPIARSSPTLTSVSGMDQLWRKLNRRRPVDDYGIDWEEWAEGMAGRVLDAYRQGEPEVEISSVSTPSEVAWAVEPYVLEDQPNVLFGEGSSGKSMMALWLAVLMDSGHVHTGHRVAVQQKRVLYLDWETDVHEIKRRVSHLQKGMGITDTTKIVYRHCTHPLHTEADTIKDLVERRDIEVVILDSLGLATGGTLDEAAQVLGYFQALRWINRTSLTLTHTNKEGQIFGSIYTMNAARNIYELKKSNMEPGKLDIGLFHRKANTVGIKSPQAYRLTFGDDTVSFEGRDAMDTDIAPQGMSVSELVYQIIKTEGPTARERVPTLVSEYKELSLDSVRGAVSTAISRHLRSGRFSESNDQLSLPSDSGQGDEEKPQWENL